MPGLICMLNSKLSPIGATSKRHNQHGCERVLSPLTHRVSAIWAKFASALSSITTCSRPQLLVAPNIWRDPVSLTADYRHRMRQSIRYQHSESRFCKKINRALTPLKCSTTSAELLSFTHWSNLPLTPEQSLHRHRWLHCRPSPEWSLWAPRSIASKMSRPVPKDEATSGLRCSGATKSNPDAAAP